MSIVHGWTEHQPPTLVPPVNGSRRGPRGLRRISGAAGRCTPTPTTSRRCAGLVVAILATAALGACAPDGAGVDVDARERSTQERLAQASQVAAESLPEGAMEVALAGYVKEGVAVSRAAAPLVNGFGSIEELAAAVIAGIEEDRGAQLWNLALTEQEFRDVVWPVLPASRPERNTPFDYTWGTLEFKSSNALATTLAKYRGHRYELLEVSFAARQERQRDYGAFVVHRDARVRVRRQDGTEEWLDFFGSVIERDGTFKVFSYVTD